MPRACGALFVVIGALNLCACATPATYRVDGAHGSDANDGQTAPFRTIARGVKALGTSDTLVIVPMPEPYRESLPLTVGGTPEAPLVVEGGGAVLSGSDPASKAGWREEGGVFALDQTTEVKLLFGPEVCYAQGKSPTELLPEQWFWQKGVLYFRPAEGKTPGDYDLEMSVRISGLMTTGAGQIVVRNLTCEHFHNDGFNIHGGSAPIWFEDITGRWNGDEGFSAHENCECYVRTAALVHNQCHGIADVNLARTHYSGLTVRDNVLKGIFFIGGFHSVIDSEVSGSPINIALAGSDQQGFPQFDAHPLRTSETNLRNVVVRSAPEEIGVQVAGGAEAVIEHSLLDGGKVGLQVAAGGRAYAINSALTGAGLNVSAAGAYAGDYNLYWPGSFEITGKAYAPERFDAYREATGNDTHSLVSEPKFIGDSVWPSRASRAVGRAFGSGFGGLDIGPAPRGERPKEDPSVLPPEAALTDTGRIRYVYDFEDTNPWSRVYPEPEANAAGEKVVGSSELSAEQAHSGKQSARVALHVPTGPPDRWLIKLFTERFAYDRPIAALRFQLFGDGSGREFRPRVRDSSGECFYGETRKLDWTGWREIAWDLTQTPPVQIAAGDGNRQQDCPPLEVVLEVFLTNTQTAQDLVLYLDDLEVELAPN